MTRTAIPILYFDNAAIPIPPKEILENSFSFLASKITTNPHSKLTVNTDIQFKTVNSTDNIYFHQFNHFNTDIISHDHSVKLSLNTEDPLNQPSSHRQVCNVLVEIYNARRMIAEFLNTNLHCYSVIFTSNATAGLELVSSSLVLPSTILSSREMWILDDNHTSVIGMAHQLEKNLKLDLVFKSYNDIQQYLSNQKSDPNLKGPCIFAFPAQSNFNGTRYPFQEWTRQFQKLKSIVIIDTASFCSSTPFDLESRPADFIVLSFYKMFGYPTGLGCLVANNGRKNQLVPHFIAGGTQDAIAISPLYSSFKPELHNCLEKGTLPIQQIVTLRFGFEYIQYKFGGWTNLSNHVMDLTRLCFQQMSQLQHYNHISLVYFYSFPDSSYSNQGPILCFNLQNGDGSPIGYHSFAKLCEMENISLRVGRMCNPGASQKHLGLSSDDVMGMKSAYGHVCGDDLDIIHGKHTGAIRISFGMSNSVNDVAAFIDFLNRYFVQPQPPQPLFNTVSCSNCRQTNIVPVNVTNAFIYPIKSCGHYKVPLDWPILEQGFKMDRCMMIMSLATQAPLTLKSVPKMNTIRIKYVDVWGRFVVISGPTLKDELRIELNRTVDESNESIQKTQICSRQVASTQVSNSQIVDAWLSRFLSHPCTLVTSTSPTTTRFTSKSPFLLVSQSSVDDLARVCGGGHVSVHSFRPNLVVSSMEAYIENTWLSDDDCDTDDGHKTVLKWNKVLFSIDGPCERCGIINIDLEGLVHREPFCTLAKSQKGKRKVEFGVYVSVFSLPC